MFDLLREIGDLDNAVINLRFSSGALGHVEVSRNAVYGYDIRTEVLGSEGAVFVGELRQTPVLLLTRDGITHDVRGFFPDRFGEAYVAELRSFVMAALGEPEPGPTIHDGRAAVEIALAARLSFRESGPVALSP